MKQPWKDRLYATYMLFGQDNNINTEPARYFAPRKPYIQKVIRQYITPDKNIRILDLGCGSGAYLYFLQQAGYQDVQGVDNSTEQVALAHRLGITVIEQLDFSLFIPTVEDETIDIVLLMDVLEHLTRPELFDLMDEVFRVLRPRGKCIAHVPNAFGLYGMQVRYGDLTHEMAFTPKSAQQLFSTTGFQDIQCFEDKPVVHGFTSAIRRIIWDLGSIPPRLLLAAESGSFKSIVSQNMLITGEKPNSRGNH